MWQAELDPRVFWMPNFSHFCCLYNFINVLIYNCFLKEKWNLQTWQNNDILLLLLFEDFFSVFLMQFCRFGCWRNQFSTEMTIPFNKQWNLYIFLLSSSFMLLHFAQFTVTVAVDITVTRMYNSQHSRD